MYKIRLLERLSALEAPWLSEGSTDDRQLRNSVIHHLQRLFNTRAGSVPIDPNYGMPDMCNIAGSFSLGTTEFLSETLLRQISRYEPRLKYPRIEVETERRDVITLRFTLSGMLVSSRSGDVRDTLSMILRINSSGQVSLEQRQEL